MPQLAQLVRDKYPGVYDDLSDQELEAAVKAKYPGVYDDLTKDEPPKSAPGRGAALDSLSTIGGAIGGFAGGSKVSPVGMALAGLGGAAGEGVAQVAGAAQNPIRRASGGMDALKQANAPLLSMLTAGAQQAGLEGVGRGVSKLLSTGAGRLYQGLMKPSKGLKQEFPDLIQTALKERAPITRGGLSKIERRIGASSDETDRLIAGAAPGATPVSPGEVVSEFAPVVVELRKRMKIGQPSQLGAVGARGRQIVNLNRRGIPIQEAQELKKVAQAGASGAYRSRDRGIIKELAPSDLLDEAAARGLRKGIEKRVPGVAAQNKRTQSLTGVKRGLREALSREGNTGILGMRDLIGASGGGALGGYPGAAGGIGLMRLLANPTAGSMTAIGANEAARLPYSQLLRAAILAQLSGTDTEEPQ